MYLFLTRLRWLFSCALLCVSIAFSASAACADTSEAQSTLKTALDSVFITLNTPQFADGSQRDAMLDHIEQVVQSIFDYDEFAARAVGVQWHTFSADQKQQFSNAFATLLRATYIEKIRGYSGNGVTYLSERQSAKKDKVEIQTSLDYEGKTVPVDYRMIHKDTWVIYDVIVEGVSLVKNYRTQFQELLSANSDPDALIKRVFDRAVEVRMLNNKKD